MAFPDKIPRIALEVTDFPEPDSPTMAKVCPGFRPKDTSRTACKIPSGVRKDTDKCFTCKIFMVLPPAEPD